MNKQNLRNKSFKFYYDKDKIDFDSFSYEDLLVIIKLRFLEVIKMCNINNELRPDYYRKTNTLLKRTLFDQYLEKHPEIIEIDINTDHFEKLKYLFLDTLYLLDIDNKLHFEEKHIPKKYKDPKMPMKEKIFEKKLIEPNLWNRFDDYCRFSMENYPYDNPDSEYMSTWLNYQDNFINEFIKGGMFYWGDYVALPPELNPILPHLTDRRKFGSN